jgi:hypothetical protein
MKIVFPFYPIHKDNVSGWYCEKLDIEINSNEPSLQIRLSGLRKVSSTGQDIKIPIESPYISIGGVDTELFSLLCSQGNAISTTHYTRVWNPNKVGFVLKAIKVVYYIGKEGVDSGYGVKLSVREEGTNEEMDVLILNLREKVVDMGYELFRKNSGRGRFIFEHHGKKYVITTYKKVELNKIVVFPQVLIMPVYVKKVENKSSKKGAHIVSLDVTGSMLGSIVLEKSGNKLGYLFPFFPVPLLSTYYRLKVHEGLQGHISVLNLPSVNIYDAGGLIVEFNLNNVGRTLYNSVHRALLEAYSILLSRNYRLEFTMMLSGGKESQEVDILKEYNVSPTAVLKALLNSVLFTAPSLTTWFTESNGSEYSETRETKSFEEGLRYHIRNAHPHRVSGLNVKLGAENTVFYSLGYLGGNVKSIEVARSYIDLNRTRFISRLLMNLQKIRVERNGPVTVPEVLAAYLLLINDLIREYKEKNRGVSKITPNTQIYLSTEAIAAKITLLMLEYGLHGVSHLLLRYIADTLKVRKNRLLESTALIVPSSPSSISPITSRYLPSGGSYINVVIDGFHYRLRGSKSDLIGLIVISDSEPYTSTYWNNALKDFDLSKFVVSTMTHLNKRDCYNIWLERRNKVRSTLSVADAALKLRIKNTHLHGLLSGLVEYIEKNVTGVGLREEGSLKPLAIPLSEFRRILMGKDGLFVNYVKTVGIGDEDVDSLKKETKYYLHAIYESVIPFCFDGCYNCTMIDKGCSLRNPLLKEWTVSRDVAKLILGDIGNRLAVIRLPTFV